MHKAVCCCDLDHGLPAAAGAGSWHVRAVADEELPPGDAGASAAHSLLVAAAHMEDADGASSNHDLQKDHQQILTGDTQTVR